MSATKRSIMWFRRDLRIGDNPALLAAIESSEQVIPLFILDKQQMELLIRCTHLFIEFGAHMDGALQRLLQRVSYV